jgi:iron complex transport system ATP-binding protein
MDMNDLVLATHHLTVGYASRRSRKVTLSDVNVTLDRGQIAALVGSNGAGKSTLLRTITGMQRPLTGAVEIGGRDLASTPRRELAQQVAVVLSDRLDPPGLRVEEVVALGRHPHRGWGDGPTDHDESVVANAISAADIDHLVGRRCGELSDGERQRVAIARALAQEPKLLVLDEPTAFLDPKAKSRMMTLVRRLAGEGAFATVIATHDLDLVLPCANTVWVAGDGRVVAGSLADAGVAVALADELDVVVTPGEGRLRVSSLSIGW